MADRARHESMVRLGEPHPITPGGAAAIVVCWLLLVVGVLLVPAVLLFFSIVAAGPVESSGPRPAPGDASIALLWAARTSATSAAVGILAIAMTITARRGRLINGWVALAISLPVVLLVWDIRFG